jgi:hypothetical protein
MRRPTPDNRAKHRARQKRYEATPAARQKLRERQRRYRERLRTGEEIDADETA